MSTFAEIVLILFIANLGTAFGAGLYETRIVLPKWFVRTPDLSYRIDAESMRNLDSGRSFWAFVSTGPLTLLTMISIILAWQDASPAHGWWLAAALITFAERLATFSFFIPTAIQFQKAGDMESPKLSSRIGLWIRLNYVRNAFTMLSLLLALKALEAV